MATVRGSYVKTDKIDFSLIDKFENIDPSSRLRFLQVFSIKELTIMVKDYNIFNLND